MTRIFFRHIGGFNKPTSLNEPLILVSNHPASFMDPILIGANQTTSIHFMVRADVFKPWLTPIFSGAQMIPIYRLKEDGKENVAKNEASFGKVRRLLLRGRSVLFFAEGYTDDVFIRKLKPIKKGPVRVGFETMEQCNWEKPLKLQALGLNYTNPHKLRSGIYMCYSEKIDIHDYRELYEEAPAAAITKLTRDLQELMTAQITHAATKEVADFGEQIMRLNRRGMNDQDYNSERWLEERFNYSRSLMNQLNVRYSKETDSFGPDLEDLRANLDSYFKELESKNVKEKWVYQSCERNISLFSDVVLLIAGLPFFVLGMIHGLLPYLLIKRFVEKTFKRSVFWASAKMVIGWAGFGIFNILFIFLFYYFISPSYLLAIGYYFLAIPALFTFAHLYKTRLIEFVNRLKIGSKVIVSFVPKRKALKSQLAEFDFIQNPDRVSI